jgi:hypothetical protein
MVSLLLFFPSFELLSSLLSKVHSSTGHHVLLTGTHTHDGPSTTSLSVAITGAGVDGIDAACMLKCRIFDQFRIFEGESTSGICREVKSLLFLSPDNVAFLDVV